MCVVTPEQVGASNVCCYASPKVIDYKGGFEFKKAIRPALLDVPIVQVVLEDFVIGAVDLVVCLCPPALGLRDDIIWCRASAIVDPVDSLDGSEYELIANPPLIV